MNDADFKMNLKYYSDYFVAVLFGESDFENDDEPLDSNFDIMDIDRDSMIEQFGSKFEKVIKLCDEDKNILEDTE